MFNRILVPVDLQHASQIKKSLECAADLAKHWDASICMIAVHDDTPGGVASGPGSFAAQLNMYAREQASELGLEDIDSRVIKSPDAAAELDQRLIQAVEEEKADLVVMASHNPGLADRLHFRSSNAIQLAKRSNVSIMIVR